MIIGLTNCDGAPFWCNPAILCTKLEFSFVDKRRNI